MMPSTFQSSTAAYQCLTSKSYVRLLEFSRIDESFVKKVLNDYFPVLASIEIDQSWSSEDFIDQDPSGNNTNHSVLIIGYDDNDNGGVWIIQNSWGDWNHGGDGIFKLHYGKGNIQNFTAVKRIEITNEFKDEIRSDWCKKAEQTFIQTVNGYNSELRYQITSGYWTLGSGGSTIIPKLAQNKYIGTRYEVTRSTEVPSFTEIKFLSNETKGVSAKSPDLNKYSWGIYETGTIVDESGKQHKIAHFKTFVYELKLLDGSYVGWWPCKKNEVEFKYMTEGQGTCGSTSIHYLMGHKLIGR
ncbi:MAG: C1 family peptidase [Elusimicrobiota bacterium]